MKQYLLLLTVMVLISSSTLFAVDCSERPTYQIGYNGVQMTSWEGIQETVYGANGVICSAGVFLEDCDSKVLTWNVTFPLLTNRKNVKYYVEIYEADSDGDLSWLNNYTLIAQSPVETIDNHYSQSTEYSVQVITPINVNHTYRARLRYKVRWAGIWWGWYNNISNSWNVYPSQEATYQSCPFGQYDSANCFVMEKPDNGFIYNNCFYVPPGKGTTCPKGTSYDSANCYLMEKPANGFIYYNNFYVQSSNGNCPNGTSYDGANCLVYLTPWGHNAFEYMGNWYVTPMPVCPEGFSYDGANCIYDCAPCGRTAFEYNGNWYYTYDD